MIYKFKRWVQLPAYTEIIVKAKLQIIKSVATIAVAFVMKLPADLDNIKFS